jgi:hypothetical protein
MTSKSHKIPQGIAVAGCKIANTRRKNIMLNTLKGLFTKDQLVVTKTAKRASSTRGRKVLSKKAKVLNLLSKGENIAWKTLRSRFDLESPRAMVDTLRAEGYMIYGNKVAGKTYYRLGTPTRAIIAAGIQSLYGTPFKYSNHKVSVRKSDLAPINA